MEVISKIEVFPSGELVLFLRGGGKKIFQYAYRAAAGVRWDNELRCFRSAQPKDGDCSSWFDHICKAVESELGVSLKISEETLWVNVPLAEKKRIEELNIL